MPLDGVFLTRLRRELAGAVVGGRVDKIHQPARETIVIAMRARRQPQAAFVGVGVESARAFHRAGAGQPQVSADVLYADAQASDRRKARRYHTGGA